MSLTPRERSILRLAATGLTNKEIALSLGLVEGTVKNYMSEAMEKVSTPVSYLDAPEFRKYWEADAARLKLALEKIGRVEEGQK